MRALAILMHRLLAVNEFPNLNFSNASALNTDDHKHQIDRIWNLLQPDYTQPLELRALHPSKGSTATVRHLRPDAYESPETNRAAFGGDVEAWLKTKYSGQGPTLEQSRDS